MTLKEAYETGRDLDVYVDSEMADQDSHSFDDLCSLFMILYR